ncbi:MAG: hypothetical protein WCX48_08630 [Bacteroidales bacterium]
MKTTINHKFIDNLEPKWNFETLYIGTFNPQIFDKKNVKNNSIDYFYGRPRNLFWDVMPRIHNKSTLLNASKDEKIVFLKENKIAITDLVTSVSFLNELKIEAEIKLLSYKDSDLNYFIPKGKNSDFVSIQMTDLQKIFKGNEFNIKRIILTRQYPLHEAFIRDTWRDFSHLYPGKIYALWTPSCWGLKSTSIGLTREDALYNKWKEMLQ